MSDTTGSKQTKQTAAIAKKIQRLRKRGRKWESICSELGILKENGEPDPGLAYRIGFEGYEPKGKEIRSRLGLREICITCMRGFRSIAHSHPAGDLAPWVRWWRRLSPRERNDRIRRSFEDDKL